MACSKQTRVRDTVDDGISLSLPYYELVQSSRMAVVPPPGGGWKLKGVLTHKNLFSKSITDMQCVLSTPADGSPAVGNCKACVKQSKQSFNMVRSVTSSYDAAAKPFDINAVRGTTRFCASGGAASAGDQYGDALSHESMPPMVPTALELSNALRSIKPSVEKFFPTVQLYEVLFELKELRKLLDLFKVKKSHNPVGDKWLGFHFGYLPLITTIEDILTILIKLDGVIDTWNDFATADRIMDFHGTLRNEEYMGNYTGNTASDAYRTHTTYVKYAFTDVHKIHMYITPHIIPGDMRFRVLLKALGIDKPIAGLWELIPFSWLVDYFVNVDDMIDDWEKGLDSMFRFSVANLGYSMRREGTVSAVRKYVFMDSVEFDTNPSLSKRIHYERVPLPVSALSDAIIPTTWGWADGPSGQQWTYVLAVATGFVPK